MPKKKLRLLDPTLTGDRARGLGINLRKKIIGQDTAIDQVVNVYQTFLSNMSQPGKPIGSLLFLGPTGTGKTRMVEAVAESLFGDPRAVIKVDCAEFQHSHEIARLIGAPPGYLGHRETKPFLSQEVINQWQTDEIKLSFVLFDEIEKASDTLWNLLLGILDKATLTLGDNRNVDFSRCMIFMTSNLGSREIDSFLRPGFGFVNQTGGSKLGEKIKRAGEEAARKRFSPEFINRIDKTIVFNSLGKPELEKILDLEIRNVQGRILTSTAGSAFVINVTREARGYLLAEGTDPRYGARNLKRTIERGIVHPLSNLIATSQVGCGDLVQISFDPKTSEILFSKLSEEMSPREIIQAVDYEVTDEEYRAVTASMSKAVSR